MTVVLSVETSSAAEETIVVEASVDDVVLSIGSVAPVVVSGPSRPFLALSSSNFFFNLITRPFHLSGRSLWEGVAIKEVDKEDDVVVSCSVWIVSDACCSSLIVVLSGIQRM